MLKGILFDMDGVLLESEQAVMSSFSGEGLSKADWIIKDLTSYPLDIFNSF
jgi:beta-phosphoglucomutase-like phosphatase (HAD superfamily)